MFLKNTYKVVAGGLALILSAGLMVPALAGVASGGAAGGGSGGSGLNTPVWRFSGTRAQSENLITPSGRVISNSVYKSGNYTGFGTGKAGHAAAMRNLESKCGEDNVKAVFGQYYEGTSSGTAFRQFIHSVPDSVKAKATGSQLLSLYKNAGLSNNDVISELSKVASNQFQMKTVVCVYIDDNKDIIWKTVPVYEADSNSIAVTCTYSRTATIKRQISDSKGRDPIGEDNLKDQAGVTIKTPFGKLVDKYEAMNPEDLPDPDEVKKQLDEACGQTETTRPTIDLSANNKAGLAEGGVLNVMEFTKDATYRVSQSIEKLKSCTAYEYESINNSAYQKTGNSRACNDAEIAEYNNKDTKGISTGTLTLNASQDMTGFWQIISVHCNKAEWDNLVTAMGTDMTIQSSNPDTTNGTFSAVAYSKVYKTIPSRLPFGDTTNTNAAQARTGSLGFYDKECPFDCTPNSSGTSATANNGANTNTGNNKTVTTGTIDKYGATSDTHTGNKFEYFRDNIAKTIKLDVWYPKNANGVTYNGEKPLTTTITRWANGTPTIDGSSGGKFTMKTGSRELFKGTATKAAVQKNWDQTKVDTPTSTSLAGLHREFTVAANWASDKDKPQVVNVKWEYNPQVSTRFATTGLGVNAAGNRVSGGVANIASAIEGKCYAQFGTGTSLDTRTLFQTNTGTGSTNNLDTGLIDGTPSTKPVDNTNNLFINFVRATGE